MKKAFLLLTASMFVISCSKTGAESTELKSDDEKSFYTIGYKWGEQLKSLNVSKREFQAVLKGATDSNNNSKAVIDLQKYSARVGAMAQGRADSVSVTQKDSGTKFIADYIKNNTKAKKTKSGLVYEVIKEGNGKKPAATDTVEVHYHGTLTNGVVFDSSVKRNKKISFPLNRVIKGWTEGLQLIKEGGKIKLVIPSDLAYGNAGAPPTIPGGATLIFEVELFKVNP